MRSFPGPGRTRQLHVLQRLIRHYVGTRQLLIPPLQNLGESHPLKNFHRAYLLNTFLKAEKADRPTALQVDNPHAAGPFLEPFHQWNAAEHRALPGLRTKAR